MEQTEQIRFRQIRNVAETINVSFDFIRENFRLFAGSLLRIALPPVVLAMVVFSYFFLSFLSSIGEQSTFVEMFFALMLAGLFGGIIITVGLTLLIGVVHVFAGLYIERGKDGFTVSDVWKGTRELFWMLFFTNLGLGIVLVVLSIIMAFVPMGQFGMYVIYAFGALYFPLRIYERRGFLQSFVASSNLVQSRWWATLGLLALHYVMAFALTTVFLVPLYIVAIVEGAGLLDIEQLVKSDSWMLPVGTAIFVLYSSITFLLSSLPLLSLIFHYYNQRERKEAPGLREEIELIGEPEGMQPV